MVDHTAGAGHDVTVVAVEELVGGLPQPGSAAELQGAPGLLLGIRPGVARGEHSIVLYPGDVLVLYTDGLVERRRENVRAGLARLVDAVASSVGAEPWELIEELAPAQLRRDDVAVLTVTVR